MALEGDGTITRLRRDNQQFYIEHAVSTDARNPFDPEDAFEVTVLPHTGLLLTPPPDDRDGAVRLADILDALDVEWRSAASSGEHDGNVSTPDHYIDPRNITL